MLSALTGLLFHLSTLFRVDAWFGALFPLPVVIAAARHGNAAARRVAVVTTLLLFVLSGPLRAANYVFLHGAMAVALGSLWNARAKWIVTVPASAAVRSAGIFASLAFSSLVLKENVMKLLVTQMFGLLDQIAANVGSTASPTVGGVWCCAVFFVLLNSLSYVAILHAVYAIVLRAVGGVDPEYVNAPDKVKQVLGVPVNGGGGEVGRHVRERARETNARRAGALVIREKALFAKAYVATTTDEKISSSPLTPHAPHTSPRHRSSSSRRGCRPEEAR